MTSRENCLRCVMCDRCDGGADVMVEVGASVGTCAAYLDTFICVGGDCVMGRCGGEAILPSEGALDALGE